MRQLLKILLTLHLNSEERRLYFKRKEEEKRADKVIRYWQRRGIDKNIDTGR